MREPVLWPGLCTNEEPDAVDLETGLLTDWPFPLQSWLRTEAGGSVSPFTDHNEP